MLRDYSSQLHSILKNADIIVPAIVFAALASLPALAHPDSDVTMSGVEMLGLGLGISLCWPAMLNQLGVYRNQSLGELPAALPRIALAGAFASILQWTAAFAFSLPVAPGFAATTGLAQAIAVVSFRLILFGSHDWLHPQGRLQRNVLIVGSGPRAAYVSSTIEAHPESRLRVLGFLDTGDPFDGHCVPPQEIFKLSDFHGLVSDHVVDEVIVACPRSMLGSIVEVVDACAAAGVPITLLSDLFGDYLPAPRTTRFGALPALSFNQVRHHPIPLIVKRIVDIAGSAALLVLTAPLLAACALAIKATSPGPVFFRQVRCGLNGRQFLMFKLRTMTADADAQKAELQHLNEMDGPVFKISRDPRITRVGGWLRRASFDELPQLWNVLKGDMSLVGPRPPVPIEVAEYQTFQRRRLSMRPGLTCIWQVSGRNRIGFDDWVRLDLEYIDTWSLTTDLRILLKTLPAVLNGDGAS